MRSIALLLTVALFHICYADSFNCDGAIGDDLRKVFLKFHNDGRRRIAKGQEVGVGGRKLNKAANMNKLRWSCKLEKVAQDYTKGCYAFGGQVGDYYALVSNFHGTQANREIVPFALKMEWMAAQTNAINEANDYDVCALQAFSQMANARVSEIGCTVTTCGNKKQIACVYNWIAIKKRPMWHTGEPCSECAATCEDGLCVRPVEKPDDGTNTMCSTPGMTDKIRNKILDTHNEYRSIVAKGLVKNLTNGNLPPARNMYKLKYDCTLEQKAAAHARKCQFIHSTEEHRGAGVGENFFTAWIKDTDKSLIGQMAVDGWFYEAKRYGIFADNRLTMALLNRRGKEVGHYTQLVWATTKHIGCAVQKCKEGYFVVCNYSPAGNTVDQLIYEPGEACSKCPSGAKCSQDEKLCVFDDFSWLRNFNF